MLPRVVLALAVLLGLWWAMCWLAQAPPAKVKKAVKAALLAALVAAGVVLTLTGKLAGLLAVAAGLAPWIMRALRLHALWRAISGLGRGRGDRSAGEDGPSSRPRPGGSMTTDEAWQVLGLSPGATPDEIRAAHRRLMRSAHPDAGGSTWIAARLNQARDILLG